ncbi:hypothetical protein A5888_002370 [Enterococcus sp. 9E7_DIV0242]|uniref:MgtC/SapB/SrpB/YhiD N-terminal domain-containing protein n=1 Tax=Candidatus Enterococcus clewellii TaxID=1834193 RepID=A0A242K4B2_9ENTE|nr:hypothetical protein A5888_002468 [Enterococcus sp. 9E7_DIV0242]
MVTMLVSILAGAVIGMERQWRKKIAGIRTMVLVSLGATLFAVLSTLITEDGSPSRIAAQIVSGVGFLAGGVILRDGFSVTGLNTAATLWCSAAVGTLIGSGYLVEGGCAAGMITLVNTLIRFFSYKLDCWSKKNQSEEGEQGAPIFLSVVGKGSAEVMLRTEIVHLLDHYFLKFCRFSCSDLTGKRTQLVVEIEPAVNSELAITEIITHLFNIPEVIEVYQLAEEETSW